MKTLLEILHDQPVPQLFHRPATRIVMAHFLIAPFVPHEKKKLRKNCGISSASFYRALADLKRFHLIEEIDGNVQWRKNQLARQLIQLSITVTNILWLEENPNE